MTHPIPRIRNRFPAWIAVLAVSAGMLSAEVSLNRIELPTGFRIELYAEDLPDARSLALGDKGTLFVATRVRGSLYAVLDSDGDHKADKRVVLASGLFMPNGVAFRGGALYVAEVNRVLRYDDIESKLGSPPEPVVVLEGLPSERHHGWKFIRFGPDGKLYVPIGAPCNICESEDPRFASITRIDPDGGGFEIFAKGVRNTVGFDWHPETGHLWFTDNGRDWLGDTTPPDELNRAPRPDMHFGYPYCHGERISDPDFGGGRDCTAYSSPEVPLEAHTAAIGMRFYTGAMFPEEYKNQIFIAEHGSWNRQAPVGYRITLVRTRRGRAVGYGVFAKGWLQEGESWGRPVDLQQMPDGALLVSDDQAGVVYRISYSGKR